MAHSLSSVQIGSLKIGSETPLVIFCGPCVIEGESFILEAAEFLKREFEKLGIGLVFKASYDKANRSSSESFRGFGLEEGLRILERVKSELGLPLVTDVHSVEEIRAAQEVVDVLQIPAFLCRQTDLLLAAADSGRVVEVKKGQFLAPWDMEQVVEKVTSRGNKRLLLVDRGTSFGYNNLVSDMRSIPVMQQFGYPVGFDATHSVQLPGGRGSSSGGQREFIAPLAMAALAAGANFLFLESHPDPSRAKSDQETQISFEELPKLLKSFKGLYDYLKEMQRS